MRAKVKQSSGFRPVQVKLDFDNAVEYAVFRRIIGLADSISEIIVDCHINNIEHETGVVISPKDLEQCARGILGRIWKRLPKGGK
jgi:hypothetical protein